MDDQVTNTMASEESVSIETSNSAPLKSNKLTMKLKMSKNSYGHVCPVCSKGFTSGKALGGHIRIHMIKGSKNRSRHRKISKRSNARSKKKKSHMVSIDDQNQENSEKVSCCICNKDFKSMKSLFGHMRNHPERNWRGIRPPPSDKNSCCSSVSENNEAFSAVEVVDQIKGSSVSDLVKSLPISWYNTVAKRFDKLSSSSSSDHDDDEIPKAAFCLMKLSQGHSFDLNHSKTKAKNSSSDRAWELKGKAKVKIESEFLTKDLNEEAIITKNNRFLGQFKKMPNEEKLDPYRGQSRGFYPKNPRYEAADHGSQVCSPKVQLDFDLNEPYVEGLDGDDQA